MAQDGQTSINIPQLIAVAFVGFLALRWFMSKPVGGPAPGSSSARHASTSTSASSTRRQAVDANKVEQISSVFPQLDRRTIAWDLHRNGGNVEGTMERVLGGRGLETPPPTFQPNLPPPPPIPGAASTTTAAKATGQQADLITRYNLQARISDKGKAAVPSEEEQKKAKNGWSADKNARAEALKQRREEMILAARRKMQEKDLQA